MDLQLAGRSVLITGANKGIGEALAHAFAAEGACLHLAAVRLHLRHHSHHRWRPVVARHAL